jgi:hypothetical protein
VPFSAEGDGHCVGLSFSTSRSADAQDPQLDHGCQYNRQAFAALGKKRQRDSSASFVRAYDDQVVEFRTLTVRHECGRTIFGHGRKT